MTIPHLNIKTSYSLLSSLITIDEYFKFALIKKLSSLAICDNNMFIVYEFQKICKKNKIKPIIGLNIKILFNNFFYNINLFARNKKGYFNLIEISSLIMINNKYNKNITLDKINNFLVKDIKIIINYTVENYQPIFFKILKKLLIEKTDLYLGVNKNNLSLLESLKKLVSNKQIIWNNKVRYLTNDDFITYKIINAIKLQILFKKSKLQNLYSWETPLNIYKQYFENIKFFINEIDIFDFNKNSVFNNLICFSTPNKETSKQFLYKICKTSLEKKIIINNKKKYFNRLNYELKIIDKMGFNDYFLIVWDYVSYAKKTNIFVGPGRGSVVGSLVSYLLNITTIDPIYYNLLFERFLNLYKKKCQILILILNMIKEKKLLNIYLKNMAKIILLI